MDAGSQGAHDDPINIHGTHLKVIDAPTENSLRVRYMHGQTFGFQPFDVGDEIVLVDAESLLRKAPAIVTDVKKIDDYEWLLTLDRDIHESLSGIAEAVHDKRK